MNLLPLLLLSGTTSNPSLSDLAWLTGDWQSAQDEMFAQETWLGPCAGSLPAVFRLIHGGRLIVHEYVLVNEQADGVFLRFRHFNPDYTTWESGDPLVYRLEEARAGYARFRNVRADQPEAPDLITYARTGDRLTATVADRPDNPDAGEPMVFEFELSQAMSASCRS